MPIEGFLKLVEIQTKVASVFPFLLGTFYAAYRFETFKAENFLLMFASLICIDMATTAINNYMDFKRANKKRGFGYEYYNGIVRYDLKESSVKAVIYILLGLAVIFGLLLFFETNYTILILGIISFSIGILYSFGPVPISHTPFGEILSGSFMGIMITFIAIYIHVFDRNLLNISMQSGFLDLKMNVPEILYIILISIPPAAGIANIMFANNICDMDDDIENKRYTLPIYIGRENALKVFRILYYIGYGSLIISLILEVAPIVSVLVLFTFIFVNRNIKLFYEKQSKKDTFILAVKNSVVINASMVITLAIAVILKYAL